MPNNHLSFALGPERWKIFALLLWRRWFRFCRSVTEAVSRHTTSVILFKTQFMECKPWIWWAISISMSHLHFASLLIKLTANDWFNNCLSASFPQSPLLLLPVFIHLLNPSVFKMFSFPFFAPRDFDCVECNLQTTIMRCALISAQPIAKVVQWEQQFLKINFRFIVPHFVWLVVLLRPPLCCCPGSFPFYLFFHFPHSCSFTHTYICFCRNWSKRGKIKRFCTLNCKSNA